MRVLILDGHPDKGRLTTALLDAYESGLPAGTQVARIAVRDLDFDPNLRRGYETVQDWEPDLHLVWQAILAADHVVLGFPLWWGAEPSRTKGLWDRLLVPTKAFTVDEGALLPDPMLRGRSADLIVTIRSADRPLSIGFGSSAPSSTEKALVGTSSRSHRPLVREGSAPHHSGKPRTT